MQYGREKSSNSSGRKWRGLVLAVLLCAAAVLAVRYLNNKNEPPGKQEASDPRSSLSIADSSPEIIPDYCGEDVIELNEGAPCFNEYDIKTFAGESYSDLDGLGRCGTAMALLNRDMMPEGPREPIGDIRPTGWIQAKYPGIVDSDPPYLYNRCHLVAYAMTGQNANELNLITGTRYMNATTMLAYEEIVLEYLDGTDNHVLYRVSPYFKEYELLARGVEIEAYSVEDKGWGVSFHVFIYNVQPGVEIDYQTGESRLAP